MNTQLWIVFHWKEGLPECSGVFSTEEKAVAACFSDSCVVCPVTLDEVLPTETFEWPGAWYPLADRHPQEDC